MKPMLLLVVALFFHYAAQGQNHANTIRISEDIDLIRLSPNAYIHVSRSSMGSFGLVSSNGLIFIDKGKAFLFDTPVTVSQTQRVVKWAEDSLHVRFVGFVPNHWHGDCMGGLSYIKARHIPSYANRMTIDIARMKHLPIPDKGFNDSLILHLGNKTIGCYYLGAAHSSDNIVVWIPSEQILFAGCMAKEMNANTKGNLSDADLKAWPTTIKKAMSRFSSARIVIPGHGDAGGIELLSHTLDVVGK